MSVVKFDKANPKDDRYYVRLYNPVGGQYRKIVRGKRAALDHEAEMKVRLKGGGVASGSDRQKTVRQLMTELLDSKKTLAPSTRRAYGNTLRLHVYPALGDVRVRRLSLLALTGFFSAVERDAGREARRTAESLVRLMLKVAVREGILAHNPLDGVPYPKRARVRGVPYAPELTDALAVRDYLSAQRRGVVAGEPQMWTALVELLIGTGLRVGEAAGVAASDLDVDKQTLTVHRQVIYLPGEGFVFAPPKTDDSGLRTIPIPQFVVAALATNRLRNGTRAIALPWIEPDGQAHQQELLFFSLRTPGRPISPPEIANRIARVARAVRLPGSLHPHGFRHRYTAVLHDAGVPQIVIDEVTGHLPVGSVSMRTYTRPMAQGRAKAREAIAEAWADAHAILQQREVG